jgi:hypothetical protein
MHREIKLENLMGRDQLKDVNVDNRIIQGDFKLCGR